MNTTKVTMKLEVGKMVKVQVTGPSAKPVLYGLSAVLYTASLLMLAVAFKITFGAL